MNRLISICGVIASLLLASGAQAQDKFVPSTVSEGAQALIRELDAGTEPGIRFEDPEFIRAISIEAHSDRLPTD